jgi:hypothetical protein
MRHPFPSLMRISWFFVRHPGFRCASLTVLGAACFVAGLALPFVRIAHGERLGPLEGLFIWLLSEDETYTLFRSIVAIWEDDNVLGAIAFIFSLLLPSFKLILLTICAFQVATESGMARYRTWAERLGPWSMLEIFLSALTLLSMKTLPLGTVIRPLPGFYFFWASIFFSLFAAWSLPRECHPESN